MYYICNHAHVCKTAAYCAGKLPHMVEEHDVDEGFCTETGWCHTIDNKVCCILYKPSMDKLNPFAKDMWRE